MKYLGLNISCVALPCCRRYGYSMDYVHFSRSPDSFGDNRADFFFSEPVYRADCLYGAAFAKTAEAAVAMIKDLVRRERWDRR